MHRGLTADQVDKLTELVREATDAAIVAALSGWLAGGGSGMSNVLMAVGYGFALSDDVEIWVTDLGTTYVGATWSFLGVDTWAALPARMVKVVKA